MSARFCKQCGAQISEGKAFCETCGTAIAASPPVPASQSAAIPEVAAAPKDASIDGTTSLQILGHRLSNSIILGGIGVLLLIVSFFLPYDSWNNVFFQVVVTKSPFDLLVSVISFGDVWFLTVVGPLIIGIVCGIIGLSRSSWILTLLSGVVSFIAMARFLSQVYGELQIVWVVVSILGGVLLIVSGLMMRQGRSSQAIS